MGTILAIDDNESFLTTLYEELDTVNNTLFTSQTGVDGLKTTLNVNPDLILLELAMPVFDGFNIMENLRANELTCYTPIIIISANKKKENIIKSMKYGIKDYISKPFDKKILNKKIKSTIEYSKQLKKRIENDNKKSIIEIRQTSKTTISIRSSLNDAQNETKKMITPQYLKFIRNKHLIIDLRYLPDLAVNELEILNDIIDSIPDRLIFLVTGKYHSIISRETDFRDDVKYFFSYSEMEIYAYNYSENQYPVETGKDIDNDDNINDIDDDNDDDNDNDNDNDDDKDIEVEDSEFIDPL